MVFFETEVFTAQIKELLTDDEYKDLQKAICENPEIGTELKGGIRKVRWSVNNSSKAGGMRAIYYHIADDAQVYMLLAYKKAKTENLTKAQEAELVGLVKEELGDG